MDEKIKELQDYLGPRLNYSTESWPKNQVDRWLLEYLLLLTKQYYQKIVRRKQAKNCW